jgi:hypothetical protein
LPDTTPPTVVGTTPAAESTNVAVNSALSITFSEAMDPATLTPDAVRLVATDSSSIPGTISYSGLTAVLTPSSQLDFASSYTLILSTAVKDLAGNPLSGEYVCTFTTGDAPDLTPPTVTATIPASGATDVAVNSPASVTFSEAMNPATISTESIRLVGANGIAVPGSINYSGLTAIFTPSSPLVFASSYTLIVSTAVTDLAGNPLTGEYTSTFTSAINPDQIPPLVVSTVPAAGATDVVVNGVITVTFSEPIDPATLNSTTFTLGAGGNVVTGSITFSGITAVFTPAAALAFSTPYNAVVKASVKDMAGNLLGADYSWSFTTAPASSTNNPPKAENDIALTEIDVPVIINVLANDIDPDGDELTLGELSVPAHGIASITLDDKVQYTPNGGFSGTDSFTYSSRDGKGGSSQAIVFVGVGEFPRRLPAESLGDSRVSLSADGRYISYWSKDDGWVVKDRLTGQIEAGGGTLSGDGSFFTFTANGAAYLENNTNPWQDVFRTDRLTGQTSLTSQSTEGVQSNHRNFEPAISFDGRHIAFGSEATNLIPGDTNGRLDIFVRDHLAGQTERVSVASEGAQANGDCMFQNISANGNYVVYATFASNLVPGDTNNNWDVFLVDRQTLHTSRISVASDGQEGNGGSWYPSVSDDGRFVAFLSAATNLAPEGDTNGAHDIFVRDRQNGTTTRVSVASDGTEGNHYSGDSNSLMGWPASISNGGRFVAFHSLASNLVSGDTNGKFDIFVHDTQTGVTAAITDVGAVDAHHLFPAISGDGRYISYVSNTSDVLNLDTTGEIRGFVAPNPLVP